MNFTAYLALIAWPLAAVSLCATMTPRRAVITAYLAAWMFLPMASLPIPGLPDWSKMSATSISLLGCLMIFDFNRIISFRPRWIDLPILAWCLCPIASSVSNNLGVYDGVSTALSLTVTWGIPYFIGRLYLGDPDGVRDMAVGLFIAGLVYIPFCAFELVMSPQLHRYVYGYHYAGFDTVRRFGGWRPKVFMWDGLMLGMWMCMSSLAGVWLWISGTIRSWRGIPMAWFVLPLIAIAILCKSLGSVLLLGAGLVTFAVTRRYRTAAPLLLLAAVAPLYVLLRGSGLWSGANLVEAANVVSRDRGGSLAVRLKNEDLLAERALEQPVFGWAGWGRSRVKDERGIDISITDGLWIIEFGQRGIVGLVAMLGAFLIPMVALLRRFPASEWAQERAAPAAALTAVVLLYLLDCLMNAMVSPIYLLMAGGVAGLWLDREPDPPKAPDVSES